MDCTEIAQVDKLIAAEALAWPQVKRLMTVPGVNVIVAATFMAAVGAQPSLTTKKMRRLELQAGAPRWQGGQGVWSTNETMRHAERELALQAQRAYEPTVKPAGASATPGRASSGSSKEQVARQTPRPKSASEEPETTPFVKEQQSRAALPLLVPSGHRDRRRCGACLTHRSASAVDLLPSGLCDKQRPHRVLPRERGSDARVPLVIGAIPWRRA